MSAPKVNGELIFMPIASDQRERMAIRRADRRLRSLAIFMAGFLSGIATLVLLVIGGA